MWRSSFPNAGDGVSACNSNVNLSPYFAMGILAQICFCPESAEFRDSVAEGVVAAVQRLYLPADADVTTGSMSIPAFD